MLLLGVPGIEALNLVIDLTNNRCYLPGINDQGKVVNNVKMSVKSEGGLATKLGPKQIKCRNNMFPENSDIVNSKCIVKFLQTSQRYTLDENIVCPYFAGTSTYEYKMWLLKNFPFWEKPINEA